MLEKFKKSNSEKNPGIFFSKFDILSRLPSFSEHIEQMKQKEFIPQHDFELQSIYDNVNIAEDPENSYNFLLELQTRNQENPLPTFATGQSGYFSEQIDATGFKEQLHLHERDLEDAKFIASCFGKTINYSENDLPILYATLPGTVEFNYAMQTFPAGIYEDVFQEGADHSLSIQPLVDEPESSYWQRALLEKLSTRNLTVEQNTEALARGERLINHFCQDKNRIYFIPIDDLKQNYASFGDIAGLRDGNADEESAAQILETTPTLDKLLKREYVVDDIRGAYRNPNFSSEYGIAIYGPIESKKIKYIEVDRAYDIMQKQAKLKGLRSGEQIEETFIL